MLSLTGKTAASLKWLDHAYRACGHPDILRAKSDQDLAAVRDREAAGFGELAAVKFAWSIDRGLFDHDDIGLINNSPFPLTNVTLDSAGSARWTKMLTAERIEPGATHRWQTWITSRGKGTVANATLTGDQ